jgi:hypothetical protein
LGAPIDFRIEIFPLQAKCPVIEERIALILVCGGNHRNTRRVIVMKKRFGVIVGMFCCLAIVFSSPALAAKVIKVGIVDCYSGPASTYTNDVRDAFMLAAEQINARAAFSATRSKSSPGTASSKSTSGCRRPRS